MGIGPNKLIAKIASDREKPNGLTIIHPETVQDFLDPLSTRVIPGIGPKAGDILMREGVKTIKDLRFIPKEKLISLFGKWGGVMYEKARGRDENVVVVARERKSIGEQVTFDKDSLDPSFLTGKIKAIADSVYTIVQKENVLFRTVTITVRFSNFETKTRAHTFERPTKNKRELAIVALNALLPFFDARENKKRMKIRLLGVKVEKLSTGNVLFS